ncbi:MAG: hypothetical protein ACRD72_23240, partial [Candidatus Angelobacter sp.]
STAALGCGDVRSAVGATTGLPGAPALGKIEEISERRRRASRIFCSRFAALRPEQAKNGLAGSSCVGPIHAAFGVDGAYLRRKE